MGPVFLLISVLLDLVGAGYRVNAGQPGGSDQE